MIWLAHSNTARLRNWIRYGMNAFGNFLQVAQLVGQLVCIKSYAFLLCIKRCVFLSTYIALCTWYIYIFVWRLKKYSLLLIMMRMKLFINLIYIYKSYTYIFHTKQIILFSSKSLAIFLSSSKVHATRKSHGSHHTIQWPWFHGPVFHYHLQPMSFLVLFYA